MYRKDFRKNSHSNKENKKNKKDKISSSIFKIGEIEELSVIRVKDFGVYLGNDIESILLPKKESNGLKVGDKLKVFIYRDSSDRLIATRRVPYITLNQLKVLKVKDVTKIGAFLDWGLEKDLFLPYREMSKKVKNDEEVMVRLYLDKSHRLSASMKGLWKLLSTNPPYKKGDMVKGRVYEHGKDFGTFVAVDDKYSAMLPRHEKTIPLNIGDIVEARVINIKEDGKMDISLREDSYKEIESDSDIIMKILEEYSNVLPFTEKASSEVILRETGLSKNAFKRAVGHLYKERKISIKDKVIRKI